MSNPILEQFQLLEDAFNDALARNDVNDIRIYLSDEWFILETSFGIVSKNSFLKAIESGQLSHSSMKKEVVQVKSYDTIAIVISKGRNVGVYNGTPFNTEVWVTNIYKQDGLNWVCIMTQESPVSC